MTEEVQHVPDLKAFVFQIDVTSFYIGLLDMNDQKDSDIMFNVHSALSIVYDIDLDDYVVYGQAEGLGDHNYIMNINKSKVISVFTPTDKLIDVYTLRLDQLSEKQLEFVSLDEANMMDENGEIDFNILEVKTIQ